METFFSRKKIEVFNANNKGRIRVLSRRPDGTYNLEVTLEQEAIPKSVQVYSGVLPMPEQDFRLLTDNRTLQFPANGVPTKDSEITITYYPRTAEVK
jgi:hypothetical protein